jgi:hypothetical protein
MSVRDSNQLVPHVAGSTLIDRVVHNALGA